MPILVDKDSKDQERRNGLMEERIERMRREKEISLRNRMKRNGWRQEGKLKNTLQKQKENEQRVEEFQKKNEDEKVKKLAIRRLQDQIQNENTERNTEIIL
jgi:hypothetical protein